jgi:hypothetical protein
MSLIIGGHKLPAGDLYKSCRLDVQAPALRVPAVRDYLRHPDMELRLGQGTKRRRKAITQIVIHWTGGEGDAAQFREVLRRRGVGAHFFIEGPAGRLGQIYQTCDPLELSTFHAGRFINDQSIGIEVACYGFRWPARTMWSLFKVPRAGRDRRIYQARVGRAGRFHLADFYPEQTEQLVLLLEALLHELPDVERTVPLEADGSLRTRRFSWREARQYSGVHGHLYVPWSTKLDPGPAVLEHCRRRFHPELIR